MGDVIWGTDFRAKQAREQTAAALEQMAVAMVAEWCTLSGGIDTLVSSSDTSPSEMNPE